MKYLGANLARRSDIVEIPSEQLEIIQKLVMRLGELGFSEPQNPYDEIDYSGFYDFLHRLVGLDDDQLKEVIETEPKFNKANEVLKAAAVQFLKERGV